MKDANDTRNVTPRLGSPLWLYMTAVSVVGACAVGYALSHLRDLPPLLHKPMFWVVAAMILAGEIWRIATPDRPKAESAAASRSITFGVLLFWGFPIAALLRGVAVLIAGIAQRHSPQRIVFNIAQLSLSLYTSWIVLFWLGVQARVHHPWVPSGQSAYILLVAAVAYFVVNFAMVATAISVRTRASIRSVVRANLPYQA